VWGYVGFNGAEVELTGEANALFLFASDLGCDDPDRICAWQGFVFGLVESSEL
jgi:hypothetical protein